ncbi:hypothetical protein BC332_33902 [Capsicum chinense]|nr:hypothetical protein BC332_33902 [Capsicum chinense]
MVFKVKEEEKTSVLIKLSKINKGFSSSTGGPWDLQAVYIGGKYFGGELPPHRPPSPRPAAPLCSHRVRNKGTTIQGTLAELIEKNAVIIVARFQCYMYFMLQTLMESLGAANYTVILGEEVEEAHMLEELSKFEETAEFACGVQRRKVLTAHAKCELVPMLRTAGAI